MIDKQKFVTGMALLAGSFGREVDAPIQAAYYRVLNPQLNDAEFERAIALTIEQETYWPSPAVLLGKVKQDTTTKALAALEHVGRVTSQHGGYRFLPHEVFQQEFDAPTKAAIAAVGGLHGIANTHEERWPSLQKKFAAAYAESVQPKLPAPAETDGKVKQLVGQTARQLTLSGRDRSAGERAEP